MQAVHGRPVHVDATIRCGPQNYGSDPLMLLRCGVEACSSLTWQPVLSPDLFMVC